MSEFERLKSVCLSSAVPPAAKTGGSRGVIESFRFVPPEGAAGGTHSKKTPNFSSILASRRTGRPMTLKKSPSSRSTSKAPRP